MRADILAVIAHPDDELLCTGLIAHHARAGRAVAIAVVTDGAGGPAHYDRSLPPRRVAEIRHAEMLSSARVLGAQHVEFLGFTDSGLTTELAEQGEEITRKIGQVIDKLSPKIVLTHGPDGEYGHPHHKVTCACTTRAIAQARRADGGAPVLYYCNAFWPDAPMPRCNRSVLANYVFPVCGRNYEARRQVMLCHVSQMHCFIGFFGPNADRECYHRAGDANADCDWFEAMLD